MADKVVLVNLFHAGENAFWGDGIHSASRSFSENLLGFIIDHLLDRARLSGVVELKAGVARGKFGIRSEAVVVNPVFTKSFVGAVT